MNKSDTTQTASVQPEPNWEGAFSYLKIGQNHVALFSDGWAVSYMGSYKVWRRGFLNIAAAKRSLTCARKRLSKIGKQ